MKLSAENDEAVRNFEDWVRRELYGPNDPRAQRSKEPKPEDPDANPQGDDKDDVPAQ